MTITDALTFTATALVSLGGGGVIVFALSSWLGRVWASRILEQDRAKYQEELERVRGDRERSVFVHRIQFEAEFRGYQEVWKTLSSIVAKTFAFRPLLDYAPKDKTREEVKKGRLEEFWSEYSSLQEVIRQHKPFLASDLDSHWEGILQALREEAIDYDHVNESDKRQSWEDRKKNLEAIRRHTDRICEAIRERVGLLVLIDEK
ncbi:MAG: hypothetical protein GY719_18695 [bacterium]|nr:hypothetical protein [bacterium]